jgi:hypothetical protein
MPALRGNYPRVNTAPIGIISLRLGSISLSGDPVEVVRTYLAGFFANAKDVHFVDIPFVIDPAKPNDMDQHEKTVLNAVNTLSG